MTLKWHTSFRGGGFFRRREADLELTRAAGPLKWGHPRPESEIDVSDQLHGTGTRDRSVTAHTPNE